ncbi:PAS domain-containing sensor histidine kinase [Aureicoccus marinus]|uniref:histidine kinase n=1 Tax=Aureicoccus marinus TaxID=754435 RepID=A0A2S7T7L3_9FLAO|nr:PAS domain-containing sensor histidine kinase [Aureicoccus marinus]PQJ15919.1 PAS domain-containing sensor histidine kinase [Aureicoccus marinus]
MDKDELSILKRALAREKRARKAAEKLLEDKSKELYDASIHLREVNGKLENLLAKKGSPLDGAFVNIIDPYVVMSLQTEVISMNASAREFLGFDHTKENVKLESLVHKDYLEYTRESFLTLLEVGILKNYQVRVQTRTHGYKMVNINASLIYNSQGAPVAAQGVLRDVTREFEIRQLLEDQKKQQDIIVGNSSHGILLIDQNKIITSNAAFNDLIGYTEDELKKLDLNSISEIDESSLFQNGTEDSDAPGDKVTLVRKYFTKEGKHFFGKTSVSSVRNSRGKLEYKVVLIEDITNDRVAEEKLKASEQRLATLISNLQTGVLLEDDQRNIVLTNENFRNLMGFEYTVETLQTMNCVDLINCGDINFADPVKEYQRVSVILKNKTLVVSDEVEMSDGRTLERDYIPLFIGSKYKGHLWTYTDITLRKNYRKNLEIQRQKYSSIIAHMNLGLVEVDQEERILMVNQSFCDMLSLEQSELIGKRLWDMIDLTEENHAVVERMNGNRKDDKSDSYEINLQLLNGQTKTWFISGAPNYSEEGEFVGSIGVVLDISEQKELEAQKEELLKELETSNKGLQEYAHIVSHDLKSPLRSVSALASWLYEDYHDQLDEGGEYNLRMIQEKIEGMDKLIDGILKYSTLTSDSLDQSTIDVNEVISEIDEIIYKPDHVRIEVVKPLPIIRADRTKIHQLFQNFLSNAVVKIDKEEGVVKIDYEETPTHWQFSVEDNGVGIPTEYHEKVFKIFQSIGNSERSTGIGLSIVKKIVDRYEGQVWLESEIGKGTTFFFTLKKQLNQTVVIK